MIARSLPNAWRFASPEHVIAARLQAADTALRRLLGNLIASQEVAEAAELALEAVYEKLVDKRQMETSETIRKQAQAAREVQLQLSKARASSFLFCQS